MNLIHHARYTGWSWNLASRIKYRKDFSENRNYNESDSLLSENEAWHENIYFLINPSFTLRKPLTLRSSIWFDAGLLAGPAINQQSEFNQQYSVYASSKHQYDITDRIMTSIEGKYDFNRWNSANDITSHHVELNSSLKYYILGFAHVDIGYNYDFYSYKYPEQELPPDGTSSNGEFMVTITYGPSSPSIY